MKILISQKAPSNMAMTPYEAIKEKYGAELEFHPFFLIEPLSNREFRSQRINLPDYTAVVFSSRHAIDAYFKLCEEMRFKVPETMKYFCTTELVATYLQKHVVYRKRKIFFGDGKPSSVVAQIGTKHKGEKFLVTSSAESLNDAMSAEMGKAGLDFTVAAMVKSVPQDLSGIDFSSYKAIVLYNPFDMKALFSNFPEFKADGIDFISYGRNIATALEEAGIKPVVKAPSAEITSAAKAIDYYLSQLN